MIERLTAFALTYWKFALILIAAVSLSFLLGQCDGARKERAVQAAARAEANVEAMKTNAVATEQSAAERVADAAAVSAHEEELIDAIQSTPDTAPDAVRVRLGCERLRASGTDITAIPACR